MLDQIKTGVKKVVSTLPVRAATQDRIIRWLRYGPGDVYDILTGNTDPLRPLRSEIFIGVPHVFESVGNEFLGHFRQLCDLQPNAQVLDIGCGQGRLARPLASFLSKEQGGHYDGCDIVLEGIEWCRRAYGKDHPHFRFVHMDVHNEFYNPNGSYSPASYIFPYDDASFDLIFLTSVFTHIRPDAAQRYLAEASRMLKPEGHLLGTWFLWNDHSSKAVAEGRALLPFIHEREGFRTAYPDAPETAICFDEDWVLKEHEERGLHLKERIHYGSWANPPEPVSGQDLIVATRVRG